EVVVKDTLLKLDWNISDSHRANLRYTKIEQNEPQLNGFSPTGLSLSSWWFDQEKTLETVVGQWFADWTDSFSTELKLSQRNYDSRPVLLSSRAPSVGLRFSGALPAGTPTSVSANNRFLNFGTENSRHFNALESNTTDVYAGATWNVGAHEVKFGADYSQNEVFNAFLQNVFGNYTFGCEPGTYSFGTITNCTAAAVTPAQRELATLENFQRGLPSAYTLQTALAGRTVSDAAASWEYQNLGLFVQDTFKVSSAFNVMFGVRLDQQKVPSRPILNTAAAAPRVAGNVTGTTVVRDTGGFGLDNTVTLDNSELVQPRVGFNWKLGTNERRMQLRGGFGLFQGAAANVWLSNPFSNTGAAVTTFSCTTFQLCNGTSNSTSALSPVFRPNPDAQVPPPGSPPAPNVDFLSPSLEQPSVWKANLAFETELPALPVVGSLVASAEWLHTKTKSGIFYRHLNLGAATRTGTDGRELFWMPQSYDAACWSGSNLQTAGACSGGRDRALSNSSFGRNILLAEKTSLGGGDAITVGLQMPTGPSGFSWAAYYT
ncbi:MAG: Oar protein, partial [Rubrivivax sp.]|nr:Oar protein [Rubrivivax sp.]